MQHSFRLDKTRPFATIRPTMFTDPTTGELTNGIAKVRYTHEAMIDQLLANPGVSQGELARFFGYTEGWVSIMLNSDAFQAHLAERRKELVDPIIIQSIETRFKAVAELSLTRVLEKLEMPARLINDDFLLGAAKLSAGALGYGARERGASAQVGVVINMPGVAPSAGDWSAKYARDRGAVVEEARPVKASLTVDHERPIALALAP